jgi:hypothetical protein
VRKPQVDAAGGGHLQPRNGGVGGLQPGEAGIPARPEVDVQGDQVGDPAGDDADVEVGEVPPAADLLLGGALDLEVSPR